ncbi:MAG: hypothetical protein R3E89_04250 [Thiolinea sp.]
MPIIQGGGLGNGLGGLPGLPPPYGGNASSHPPTAPLPPNYVPPRSLTPSNRPGAPVYPYPQPPQSQPAPARRPLLGNRANPFAAVGSCISNATGRAFNPFATLPQQTETAPILFATAGPADLAAPWLIRCR